MKTLNINSSIISTVGYDYQSCILEIKFKRGATYHYTNVPSFVVCQLLFSESVGSFFMRNIKDKYQTIKL